MPDYFEGGMRNGSSSIDNSTNFIIDSNDRRKRITFVNNDAALTIWLYKGGGATANKGIMLRPYGSYEDIKDSSGYIYRGPYTAIASAAGPATLSWIEES